MEYEKNNFSHDIIYIIILVILGICFASYIIISHNQNNNSIISSIGNGIFSVENGFTFQTNDDILSNCYDGKTKCIFTNIKTLTDAINVCDLNKCQRFSYDSSASNVYLLKTSSKYLKNSSSDVYNRN